MSHIVSIRTQIRDRAAVEAACSRLHWPPPVVGTHKLFTKTVVGLGVRAPRWQYPIVCDLTTGELSYDNYEGRWGDPVELDRFKQSYAVEKTKLEARKQGRYVSEQTLADGSVQLTVQLEAQAGGAGTYCQRANFAVDLRRLFCGHFHLARSSPEGSCPAIRIPKWPRAHLTAIISVVHYWGNY